jgi:hypothetical protein
MQNNTVARLSFHPLYSKCDVLRESLSEDRQNMPCNTKEKGVVANLYIYLRETLGGQVLKTKL